MQDNHNDIDSFNNIMEQQIGDLGGEPKTLGKLNHVPGQQETLTDSERQSLAQFQARTQHHEIVHNDVKDGWIPIDRGEMGIRSQFYPEDWQFRIKPASVEAIKNWSSIDEENLSVINNVMNEIIKTCVSIKTDRGSAGWDKLNSWDRFWFILKVREYTFQTGEQVLEFDEECDNCNESVHYQLRSEQLYYEFPDDEVIDKHWSIENRRWEINPHDYNVPGYQGGVVHLYVPTLGKDNAILQWLYAQQEAGKNIDEPFTRFLPFMLEKAPKDANLVDKFIRDCHREFKSWDTDMFLFMDEVRRNITINPSEKLTQTCPNCGEEVTSTVKFPNGIKYLFAVQSRHSKFGSK